MASNLEPGGVLLDVRRHGFKGRVDEVGKSIIPYDSASSRAHAPQAGAALESTSNGRPAVFASARAESTSLLH